MYLADKLLQKKPNMSPNSIKTYTILLKNLYYEYNDTEEIFLDWFNNQDEIIELLRERSYSTKKTLYYALMCIADQTDKYREELTKNRDNYKREIIERKTAPPTSYEDIKSIYEEYYENVRELLNAGELTKQEYVFLQDFIILSLVCGYWFSPIRSTCWCTMKIRNISQTTDNYIKGGHFIFHKYPIICIPKGLKIILTKWTRLNPSDYLISDQHFNPMTNVKLSQRINIIFQDSAINMQVLKNVFRQKTK